MTRAIAVASLLLLGACASTQATFESTVDPRAVTRIRRLFVYTNVEDLLPAQAFAPFEKQLVQVLAQCQVTTRVMQADQANPERDRIALRAMRAFDADAVLLMRTTKRGAGAPELAFQLMDVKADRSVWTARSDAPIEPSGAGAGEYASAVVEQLKKDRLLRCAAGSEAGAGSP